MSSAYDDLSCTVNTLDEQQLLINYSSVWSSSSCLCTLNRENRRTVAVTSRVSMQNPTDHLIIDAHEGLHSLWASVYLFVYAKHFRRFNHTCCRPITKRHCIKKILMLFNIWYINISLGRSTTITKSKAKLKLKKNWLNKIKWQLTWNCICCKTYSDFTSQMNTAPLYVSIFHQCFLCKTQILALLFRCRMICVDVSEVWSCCPRGENMMLTLSWWQRKFPSVCMSSQHSNVWICITANEETAQNWPHIATVVSLLVCLQLDFSG